MGGVGSGRRATRLSVSQCRCLSLAELCDGGRLVRQPHGEVQWRAAGELRGRLTYRVACGLLHYRYWPTGGADEADGYIALQCVAGRRTSASCPSCGSAVRDLYAPPGRERFACRRCSGLVYRPPTARLELEQLRDAAAPNLAFLASLPDGPLPCPQQPRRARLPQELAEELEEQLPLAPEELRLWTLRLRSLGLSCRRIATLTGSSKSSVARCCQAGRAGIDRAALIRECLVRARALPPLPQGDDPRVLRRFLAAIHNRSRTHRLTRAMRERPQEERVVLSRPLFSTEETKRQQRAGATLES